MPFTGIVPPLSIQISTVGLTLTLGICVGDGEGSVEGISVGKTVGVLEGTEVGDNVGCEVGDADGEVEGLVVGEDVGFDDGLAEGEPDGVAVGTLVGANDGVPVRYDEAKSPSYSISQACPGGSFSSSDDSSTALFMFEFTTNKVSVPSCDTELRSRVHEKKFDNSLLQSFTFTAKDPPVFSSGTRHFSYLSLLWMYPNASFIHC